MNIAQWLSIYWLGCMKSSLQKSFDLFISICTFTYIFQHMAVVALKCMGELLTRHTHFNFTTNIIQALVPYLNHHDDDIYSLVASYFTKLFKTDKPGHLSLEVSNLAFLWLSFVESHLLICFGFHFLNKTALLGEVVSLHVKDLWCQLLHKQDHSEKLCIIRPE